MKSEKVKEPAGSLYKGVKALLGVDSVGEDIEEQISLDQSITDTYGICDIEIPIFGHICDKLDYPEENPFIKIVGMLLLGLVIFIDIVLDIWSIITQLGAGYIEMIPIIGPFISAMEEWEIDDILDTFSLVVVFIFCGPVAALLPAFGEFQEGIVEFIPWWTVSIGVWFFFVRPARKRMFQLEDLGVVEDDIRLGDKDYNKLSEAELLERAKEVYKIK